MTTSNIQFQQNMTATIQELQTEIGQLATIMNQLQSKGFGQIVSQTIPSPQANMSTITLGNIVGANIAKVVEVVVVQPPLPSIVQLLHPLLRELVAKFNNKINKILVKAMTFDYRFYLLKPYQV
ncbi:hypothetical protein CR513_24249, partial [Mucuna pruriens]